VGVCPDAQAGNSCNSGGKSMIVTRALATNSD